MDYAGIILRIKWVAKRIENYSGINFVFNNT